MRKSNKLTFTVFFVTIWLSFAGGISVMGQTTKSSYALTANDVVNHIDSLYDNNTFAYFADESYIRTKGLITDYYTSLPAFDKKDHVFMYYHENIILASETEGQNESLLRNSIIYLMLPTVKDRETAYQAAAMAYANNDDKDNLQLVIDDFSAYSKLQGDAYSETIRQMKDTYHDILNQVPFTEQVKGTWVMTIDPRPHEDLYFPFSIIEINDITKNYGISMRNYPGHDDRRRDHKETILAKLLHSQLIGGHNGFIQAAFGSEQLIRGNDEFAQSGFEATRQLRADMSAEISTSNTNIGNKMIATAATGVVTGLFDALFSSTAESSTRVAAMNLSLNQTSPDVLQGNLTYYDYTVNVSQMNAYRPTPTYNTQTEYVRWTPGDSIFFVNGKGNIYSLNSKYDLDLNEYNEIKKQYSWKRPKYLLPIVGCEIAGAALATWSVFQFCNLDKKDKNGNYIYDDNGHKVLDDGKFAFALATAILAEIVMLSPLFISDHRKCAREKAFGELNQKNLRKLRQKATTLSFSPMIQGTSQKDLSLGLQAGIKFY